MGAKSGEARAWVEVEPWEVSPVNLAEPGVQDLALGSNPGGCGRLPNTVLSKDRTLFDFQRDQGNVKRFHGC